MGDFSHKIHDFLLFFWDILSFSPLLMVWLPVDDPEAPVDLL